MTAADAHILAAIAEEAVAAMERAICQAMSELDKAGDGGASACDASFVGVRLDPFPPARAGQACGDIASGSGPSSA